MEKQSHNFCLPAWTAGQDAYQQFPLIAENTGKRIFLVGGKLALRAGRQKLMDAAAQSELGFAGIHEFAGVCSMAQAQALGDKAIAAGSDMICAMGGGRAIDCAKAAGELSGLPVFAFPTIVSTCAAVTSLSVMYHEDGSFERFFFLKQPPKHTFIDMEIIAQSPCQYLRAGIGDSLAKHVESNFSARGASCSHADVLGLSIAQGLAEPLLKEGEKAMRDNERGINSEALAIIALQNIVSVGCVSLLVKEAFNCALAHSLYYALEGLTRRKNCLHGDVVAWGTLVQLVMDAQEDKAKDFLRLLHTIGTPCSLAEMGLDFHEAEVQSALTASLNQPDMCFVPYPISPKMVFDAALQVEEMAGLEVSNVY